MQESGAGNALDVFDSEDTGRSSVCVSLVQSVERSALTLSRLAQTMCGSCTLRMAATDGAQSTMTGTAHTTTPSATVPTTHRSAPTSSTRRSRRWRSEGPTRRTPQGWPRRTSSTSTGGRSLRAPTATAKASSATAAAYRAACTSSTIGKATGKSALVGVAVSAAVRRLLLRLLRSLKAALHRHDAQGVVYVKPHRHADRAPQPRDRRVVSSVCPALAALRVRGKVDFCCLLRVSQLH